MPLPGESGSQGRQLPLAGIRIVNFGHYISAPLAARLLADQGAEVTHIVRPGTDSDTVQAGSPWNRATTSLCIDLKDRSCRDSVHSVIRDADIVIENFRPGVMSRLGFGPMSAREVNPRLIYCSIPGFAATDRRAHVHAWEGIVASACGLYWSLSSAPAPAFTALPLASIYGGLYAALNIAAALVRRERSGTGATIEVPLFTAMLAGMINFHVRHRRGRLAAERNPSRKARSAPNPFATSYQCADGRHLYILAPDHSRFASRLLSLAAVPIDPLLGLVNRDPWLGADDHNLADPLFLAPDIRNHLHALLTEAFLTRPAADWEEALASGGVPAAVCRSTTEWLEMNRGRTQRCEATVRRAACAPLEPSVVVRSRCGEAVCGGAAARGRQAAWPDVTSKLGRGSAALSGLRVLDLSSVIAGPTCGRILAELGADVIKIDTTKPLHNPILTCGVGIEVNRGKRSVLVDVKQPAGDEVLRRLIAGADVSIHNSVTRCHTDHPFEAGTPLIDCRLSAYGADGSWSGRKAYDPVVQAASGIQTWFGSRSSKPRVHGTASTLDFATGVAAAYGVVLAVFRYSRSGRSADADAIGPSVVETSLAQMAFLVQSDAQHHDVSDNGPKDDGCNPHGYSLFSRIYRCRDGWIYVAVQDPSGEALLNVPPFSTARGAVGESLELELERLFRTDTVGTWQALLDGVNVAAHPVSTPQELLNASIAANDGLFVTLDFDTLGPVDVRASGPCLSPGASYILPPAPKMGMHTREVLGEVGFSASAIDELVAQGVVAETLGTEYVP